MRTSANRIKSAGLGLIRLVLLAAGLLFLGSGCSVPELNERSIVSMVGIDQKDDGTLRLTLGLIKTEKNKSSSDKIAVYTTEGRTLFEASRKFIQKVGNQPLWPYIKVIVIGPGASRQDVVPVLDFFNRNNEIQPNPYIVVSQESAEDIVKMKSTLSVVPPAIIVEQQINNQSLLSLAPQVQLYQFTEMMYTPGKIGFASLVKESTVNGKKAPKVEGMAVIKNGKWVGELGPLQTRGVLWVRKEVKGGVLVIGIEGKDGQEEARLSMEILEKNKVSIKPALNHSELSATIDIKCKLSIGEVFGYTSLDQSRMALIKEQSEKQIKKEVEDALKIAQKKWKADIFGINQQVERKYPQYWKSNKDKWDELFAELPVEVHVSADVQRIGLMESCTGK